MADKPIIFSGPMVRALLAGRKAMTRRVLKPQPIAPCLGFQHVGFEKATGRPVFEALGPDIKPASVFPAEPGCVTPYPRVPCAPGDRLWVREATVNTPAGLAYVADGAEHYGAGGKLRKRPSIHMPRWASRITLIVEGVKVERLQDISEEDALAEGVEPRAPVSARENFAGLWCLLHGPDAWDANPWVAAISFRVIRENIDRIPAETGAAA